MVKKNDIVEINSNSSKKKLSKEESDSLPIEVNKSLAPFSGDLSTPDPLKTYLKEISRYALLSPEQEKALVKTFLETGDLEVAKQLVMANLRLVVKIAMEYRHTYKNVMDLIQEGNIGLMKAVSKYDPSKGAKLSYYASWWIKSYILKFILDNFRLVKIGTTNDQKKLFYNLLKEKQKLMSQGIEPSTKQIAYNLGVSEESVETMEQRLSFEGPELSLDAPIQSSDSGKATLSEVITDTEAASVEDIVSNQQEVNLLNENLKSFIKDLKPRDKDIFKKRLLSEVPPSLQEIANEYGVSRERIRQIEERLLKSLKVYMSEFIR